MPATNPPAERTTDRTTDRTYDILRSERSPLGALFQPRTVAVIGASERADSVGLSLIHI